MNCAHRHSIVTQLIEPTGISSPITVPLESVPPSREGPVQHTVVFAPLRIGHPN